ncbi:hypothetical protein ACFPC0_10555 [Streptomyces andamanensis]|uniref:Uncharacterized protein n=1 Tax=Streptomyces andamanensis TaxID=1565035 RepID=A0ABV8TCJ0_9ACTN
MPQYLEAETTLQLTESLRRLAYMADERQGETLMIALNDVEDEIGEAFANIMSAVMELVPPAAAPRAERAVRALLLERASNALDGHIDRADDSRLRG